MRNREFTKEEIESRLVGGESLRAIARSLGMSHEALRWQRFKWGGKPLRASRVRRSPLGNRYIDQWGYVMIRTSYKPGQMAYTPEHVLVVEKRDGRKATKGERVHHINGLVGDNRPENLYRFADQRTHKNCHVSLENLAMSLVHSGVIVFRDGVYKLA